MARTSFTEAELNEVRRQWARVHKIDPTTEAYTKLIAWLDSLDQSMIRTLANANIRFVSSLARNRVTTTARELVTA